MLHRTVSRTVITSVAVLATTLATNTVVSTSAETKEAKITSGTTESVFHKSTNMLEAKLSTINTMNPDHLSGLQNVDGQFYFFDEDGSLHTGWKTFGDNTVYYDENGNFTTGLVTLEDEEGESGIYYFDEEGKMTTGWVTVEDVKYYFHEDGKAETGTWKDGDMIYTFNEDGELTESHKEVKEEPKPVQTQTSTGNTYTASNQSSYTAASSNTQSSAAVSQPQATASQPAAQAEPTPAPAPAAPAVVDDGALGTIAIGGYSARVYQGGYTNAVNQPIVDAPNSAVLMNYLGRQMIADHAHQGFSVIRSCGPGSTGSFCGRTIVCASSYQGTNTGNGIMLADGRWADEVYDGTYIMYTCNDASGVSVTVTFWN